MNDDLDIWRHKMRNCLIAFATMLAIWVGVFVAWWLLR